MDSNTASSPVSECTARFLMHQPVAALCSFPLFSWQAQALYVHSSCDGFLRALSL